MTDIDSLLPIRLHSDEDGELLIVSVEYKGKWIPVITDYWGGIISRVIEPAGIQRAIEGKNRQLDFWV